MKRKYRILSSSGIDEKLYININGHNQYVFIRGKDINNPIILNIHGGPANPDAFLTYEFAQAITDEFTYISWDQRGCGRTYYKNKHIDPKGTYPYHHLYHKILKQIYHHLFWMDYYQKAYPS